MKRAEETSEPERSGSTLDERRVPFLMQFESRPELVEVIGEYDEHLQLNVVNDRSGARPLIIADPSVSKTWTKTNAVQEEDDEDEW